MTTKIAVGQTSSGRVEPLCRENKFTSKMDDFCVPDNKTLSRLLTSHVRPDTQRLLFHPYSITDLLLKKVAVKCLSEIE